MEDAGGQEDAADRRKAKKAYKKFIEKRAELIREALIAWIEELRVDGFCAEVPRIEPGKRVFPLWSDRIRELDYPNVVEDALLELIPYAAESGEPREGEGESDPEENGAMGDNGEGGERMVIGVKQKKGVAFHLLSEPARIEIEASKHWFNRELVPAVFAEQELVGYCRLCGEPHEPKRFVIRADEEHSEQAAKKLNEIRDVMKRLAKK